jgi:flagellar basal body rod protein FlgF
MKQIVEVQGEGLVSLLGQRVTLYCLNYIYEGKLVGVNDNEVKIEDAGIVYETGELNAKTWKDRQCLPNPLYVRSSAIESYTVMAASKQE